MGAHIWGKQILSILEKKKLGMRTSLTFPFALQDPRIAEKE